MELQEGCKNPGDRDLGTSIFGHLDMEGRRQSRSLKVLA